MDSHIISGKWNEFKGEIRKLYGKITNDDLEQTRGNVKAVSGLVEQRYGQFSDDARTKFDDLLKRFSHEANEGLEGVKENLRENRDKH